MKERGLVRASSGRTEFNPIQWILFLGVMGLVLYSIIGPWSERKEPPAPVPAEKRADIPRVEPQSPNPTPTFPPRQDEGSPANPDPSLSVDSTGKTHPAPPEVAGSNDVPDPAGEDDFAKGWYFQSVIGDIVELYFGDGTGRDVQVGKPFETPEVEGVTVVEIGPDRQTVLVERDSDGRRFSVPKRVVVDLTTVEPSLVEAFHFSVHGLDPERLAEGVAEPVIAGRKPTRYFFAHAASKIVFSLSPGSARFRATGYLGGRGGKVRFIVRADGTDVFSSIPVDGPGAVEIDVALPATLKTLELVVDPLGSHGADHSFWIEPVLEK